MTAITCFQFQADSTTKPIHSISSATLESWRAEQSSATNAWLDTMNFKASAGEVCIVPGEDNQVAMVLLGVSDDNDCWSYGALPAKLPAGSYQLPDSLALELHELAAIAWGLGAYQFERYKEGRARLAKLVVADQSRLDAVVSSIYAARDWINTPTEDFNPADLQTAAEQVAADTGASCHVIIGDDLLKQNYPLVHAVGRAGATEPRLIELRYGAEHSRKVTLVGKGVCYDTGGLSIKGTAGMKTMKKDMAGAALALSLARAIMLLKLPIQLRVLLPAVENSVAGNSFRPGDVIIARNGSAVEIGNTDAEGRLILADALTAALEENPDQIFDFATLTGAQRVALGPDVPSFFTDDESIAQGLEQAALQEQELLWRLPLISHYREYLNSDIAHINNSSSQPYAGAITAALFLQHFIGTFKHWCHFDFMGSNKTTRPGRPGGGEVQSFLTVLNYLQRGQA